MRMPEGVHGDPGAKIQVTAPVRSENMGSLPPLKGDGGARVGRQDRRNHGSLSKVADLLTLDHRTRSGQPQQGLFAQAEFLLTIVVE
jgi:hypothetical protein